MANQVKTEFIASGVEKYLSSFDAAQKRLDAFNAKTNNSFINAAPPFSVPKVDAELNKALADIKRFEAERLDISKSNSLAVRALRRAETQSIADEARAQTRAFKNELNEINKSLNAPKTQAGSSFGGIGSYIVPAAIAATAFSYGKDALDAAKQADSAQRLLRASAIETGISYEKLTESAAKFGSQTLQSNAAAQSSFASIVNFANAAGRADKLDEFRTKFADLAAAKGIDPSNLGVIAKQLNALTDEATDKLLNANPSAFYDKFAKSIGKTANSLSDAEKRAAVFDEVLKKGAIFSGQAESRLNAAASATDRLSVKFDNFKEKAGAAVLPLAQFVEFAAKLATVDPTLYKSSAESAAGRNNAEILSKQRVKDIVEVLRQQDEEIRSNVALSGLNLADNFFNPEARAKAITAAKDAAKDAALAFKSSFDAVLSDKGASIGLLKLGQAEFYANQSSYDNDTRRKLAVAFETSIADVQKAEADKREQSRKEAQKKRADDAEKAKKEFDDLTKSATTLFEDLTVRVNNNPFVSLFTEADREARKLNETVSKLPKFLQDSAKSLLDIANSNKLFETRITNALSAQDLRDEADNFRNAFNPVAEAKKRDEQARAFDRQRNFFSPNKQLDFDKLTSDQKRDLYEQSVFSNAIASGQNPNDFVSFLARQRGQNENENFSLQQRLDRKIDLITGSNPLTAEQRAIAERQLISLTQGIDPNKLTSQQRDIAATARENEALRRDAYEKQNLDYQKRIAVASEAIANRDAQELAITLKNETEGGAEVRKQAKTATSEDAKVYYGTSTTRRNGQNYLSSF